MLNDASRTMLIESMLLCAVTATKDETFVEVPPSSAPFPGLRCRPWFGNPAPSPYADYEMPSVDSGHATTPDV